MYYFLFNSLTKILKIHYLSPKMAQKYKIYDINCGKCGTYTLTYHKYGAGKGILRLYHEHIKAPSGLVSRLLASNYKNIKSVGNLFCSNPDCREVLGVPALSKSKKWVFRMRQGLFHRKLRK